jgi:hypothetical protein
MPWRKRTKKFLCQVILERTNEPSIFDEEACDVILRREATDWLFVGLGAFTHIYLVLLAIFFFGRLQDEFPSLFLLVDTLQEPYFGALGIYVILKEVRKRRRVYPSRYWGELFVAFWVLLVVSATVITLVSPTYHFDDTYKIILTSGLVVILVYMGGLINRP